jgi:hypothetical protein
MGTYKSKTKGGRKEEREGNEGLSVLTCCVYLMGQHFWGNDVPTQQSKKLLASNLLADQAVQSTNLPDA